MKKILLPLVLIPLLLTGCAGGGYYGYSGPAYYDGPDVGVAFVGGDSVASNLNYHRGSWLQS
jgi:hypothetical protein